MPIIRQDSLDSPARCDVIVVGAGACGMTAALAARDGGAEVVVLERDAVPSGTTGMSLGSIAAAGTKSQRDAGIEDTAGSFFDDIMAKTKGQTDPVMARVIAEMAGPTVDWLTERHGIPLSIDPAWGGVFGHSRPRLHGVPGRNGAELLASLLGAAKKAGATLVTSALVSDVYVNADDRVLGVAIQRPDGSRDVLGCDALVLATCGFAANPAMRQQFIPHFAQGPIWAPETADGSGIAWGIEMGAATADMGAYQGFGALHVESGIQATYNVVMTGGIQVNANGERFNNEVADISAQGDAVLRQPGSVAWMVFDEKRHQDALLWPAHRRLNELGQVYSAPDAAALAVRLGLPPAALAATVASVVGMAHGATDPLGRDFTGYAPLKGALYAVKCAGALLHTQGGLVVDAHAQVCRPDGSTLPNLFAGGGTARSICGPGVWGYLPASGLCTSVTLGHLAGRAAAQLASKSNHEPAIA